MNNSFRTIILTLICMLEPHMASAARHKPAPTASPTPGVVAENPRQAQLEAALQAIYAEESPNPLLGEWLNVDGFGIMTGPRIPTSYATLTNQLAEGARDGTICSTAADLEAAGTTPKFIRIKADWGKEEAVLIWENTTGKDACAWLFLAKVVPDVKAIKLEWDVRTAVLTRGNKPGDSSIDLSVGGGTCLDTWTLLDSISEQHPEWTTMSAVIPVTPGTDLLCLKISFTNCIGRFEIQNMEVTGLSQVTN
jgi:hypothetical protein